MPLLTALITGPPRHRGTEVLALAWLRVLKPRTPVTAASGRLMDRATPYLQANCGCAWLVGRALLYPSRAKRVTGVSVPQCSRDPRSHAQLRIPITSARKVVEARRFPARDAVCRVS